MSAGSAKFRDRILTIESFTLHGVSAWRPADGAAFLSSLRELLESIRAGRGSAAIAHGEVYS